MRNAIIVVASLFFLCGLAILVRGKGHRTVFSETEVEKMAPLSVGSFVTQPSQQGNNNVTYKMDQVTYQTLDPFGIVCRVMANPNSSVGGAPEAYDTVFIVGDGEHTFHTPEICFQTQGNEILKQDYVQIPTKTRGIVPATLLEIKNEQHGGLKLAAFTFQGPKGLKASASNVINDMLLSEFFTGSPKPSAFYRFIAQNEGDDDATRNRLITFMGDYLDEIHKTSDGRF